MRLFLSLFKHKLMIFCSHRLCLSGIWHCLRYVYSFFRGPLKLTSLSGNAINGFSANAPHVRRHDGDRNALWSVVFVAGMTSYNDRDVFVGCSSFLSSQRVLAVLPILCSACPLRLCLVNCADSVSVRSSHKLSIARFGGVILLESVFCL